MRIETACIFLNVSSPFNVLNGLCTGEVEFQAIFVEDKDGKMVMDCIEEMDIANITFAGNKLEQMGYQEFKEWSKQVNTLMKCDIENLIYENAKSNLDKAHLLEFAENIKLPNQKSNRNCCCH